MTTTLKDGFWEKPENKELREFFFNSLESGRAQELAEKLCIKRFENTFKDDDGAVIYQELTAFRILSIENQVIDRENKFELLIQALQKKIAVKPHSQMDEIIFNDIVAEMQNVLLDTSLVLNREIMSNYIR